MLELDELWSFASSISKTHAQPCQNIDRAEAESIGDFGVGLQREGLEGILVAEVEALQIKIVALVAVMHRSIYKKIRILLVAHPSIVILPRAAKDPIAHNHIKLEQTGKPIYRRVGRTAQVEAALRSNAFYLPFGLQPRELLHKDFALEAVILKGKSTGHIILYLLALYLVVRGRKAEIATQRIEILVESAVKHDVLAAVVGSLQAQALQLGQVAVIVEVVERRLVIGKCGIDTPAIQEIVVINTTAQVEILLERHKKVARLAVAIGAAQGIAVGQHLLVGLARQACRQAEAQRAQRKLAHKAALVEVIKLALLLALVL